MALIAMQAQEASIKVINCSAKGFLFKYYFGGRLTSISDWKKPLSLSKLERSIIEGVGFEIEEPETPIDSLELLYPEDD